MRTAFRALSLRRKLTLATMATSGAGLLFACVAFVAYDAFAFTGTEASLMRRTLVQAGAEKTATVRHAVR